MVLRIYSHISFWGIGTIKQFRVLVLICESLNYSKPSVCTVNGCRVLFFLQDVYIIRKRYICKLCELIKFANVQNLHTFAKTQTLDCKIIFQLFSCSL